jgi:folate-binding protein YgfZ
VPSSSTTRSSPPSPPGYAAARESLAHRERSGAVAIEGADRVAFLQGQLTQEVRGLEAGASRPAAGLTPKGKLLFFGSLVAEADRLLLLLPSDAVPATVVHLARYAAFQKAAVRDASADYARFALYGPEAGALRLPAEARRVAGGWDLAGEILAPCALRGDVLAALEAAGSAEASPDAALALRVEAGRPVLGTDTDASTLPDEVGLQAAISTTKGCYVGQEVVARLRTYGRVSRRLVGFRFTGGEPLRGVSFPDPEKPSHDLGRVTSAVVSPRFGAVGLGYASRDVDVGAVLRNVSGESAEVSSLPFA